MLFRKISLECIDSNCQRLTSFTYKKYFSSRSKGIFDVRQSANVFLMNDGRAKIGDMNVSKISEKGLCQTQTGTPYYASPQVWKDQVYGMKSDIWSLGVVLYEMICLRPPFQA